MKLLQGIRVLDLSRLLPGPQVTALLGDMGADVLKVEEPKLGDYLRINRDPEKFGGRSPVFLWNNRNKRGVAIDWRTPEGKEIVYDLAKTCHVAVEGARPGAMDRAGLGYEDLRKVNPKIVYLSITGFGQDGPFAQLATHGGAYDAVAGLSQPVQLKNGSYVQYRPYPHGWIHGSWLAAMAVMGALIKAQNTGEGSYIDISCTDATLMCLGQEILGVLNGENEGWADPEEEPSAKYSYYKTKDDRFMLIQAIEQHFWVHFCETIGRPDLATRGDWSVSHMDSATGDIELRNELINIFATRTQAEWTKIFIDNNIAGAPYYPLKEVPDTDLTRAREMISFQQHPIAGRINMVSNAIKVKGDKFEVSRPAPEIGQHTDEILNEIGYSAEKLEGLKKQGVIAQANV